MSLGNIRKLQENTAALYIKRKTLQVSAIRGSGHVWPGKLKRPPLPFGVRRRMWYIRRRWNVGRIEFLPAWNELCCASQWGLSAYARCRDLSSWWDGARKAIRINSIRIPQEDTWRTPLFGLPQGEARDTRDHHTPDDSISYPDVLSGSLTKVSKPCYVIPPACHSSRSAALRWCVRTPCPDIFAMDSKELSSISDCLLWW